MVERNKYWLGAFSLEHRFPMKEKQTKIIIIEVKAFGPYTKEVPTRDYVKMLNQLMLGVPLRF
jgi:excinuclease UvrABC nuclease subunit